MCKPIPQTTKDACDRYQASPFDCNCPDYDQRGGSYTDPKAGDSICKHIWHMRTVLNPIKAPQKTFAESQAEQKQRAEEWISKLFPVVPALTANPALGRMDFLEI